MTTFDVGYGADPFRTLCEKAPAGAVYPSERFRIEWGPIFHRGRLDGTAKVLVIGQDPAAHEGVARRILCGVAGHRVQGFLAKLGIDRSYVMVNAYLYSLFGTAAPTHTQDQLEDRYDWLDAITSTSDIEVVVTFGAKARIVWEKYVDDRAPSAPPPQVAAVHPTAHLSDADMLANWNAALSGAHGHLQNPDRTIPLVPYGDTFDDALDLAEIPDSDLPAGLPTWMAGAQTWAVRGENSEDVSTADRITITIPASDRIDRP
jgi:uracil-DNA glycosylase